MVTSTTTSLHTSLLSVTVTINEVSFSTTECCGWFNDSVASTGVEILIHHVKGLHFSSVAKIVNSKVFTVCI